MNHSWQRSRSIGIAMSVAAVLFALGRPALAQNGSGIGPSAFSGSSGWFSSRLVSNPIGFHPVPSAGTFPGSVFRPMRAPNVGVRSPSLNVPGGFSAANPFSAFYGNPAAPGPTGRFDEPLSQISATANATYAGVGAASAEGISGVGGFTPIPVAGPAVIPLGDLLAVQSLLEQSAAAAAATASGAVEAAVAPGLAGPAINLNVSGAAPVPWPLVPPLRPRAPLKPREDLQQILTRSSSLSVTDSIQVLSDGATVFLRGVVANESDRRMAEGLLRLSPGVEQIQNELKIGPARP